MLDLGCGTGRALELVPAALGADASLEMIRKAPRGRVVCARAGALPFRPGAFQALLCSNSFHHYAEPAATLREIRRVLAPGGRAVLIGPNLEHPLARLTIYGGEALLFGMDVHLHSARDWVELCSNAGFSRTSVTPMAEFPLGAVSLCIEAQV
jgi:SAM-dependent methyltransferase